MSFFFNSFNLRKYLYFGFYFTWFYLSAGLDWEGTQHSGEHLVQQCWYLPIFSGISPGLC